ncbi:MAG: hypothetical protein OXH14_06660 [Alphaproteobacteria bacterium]|nr:hypothetical protein [Alphaproteobacteria bacterium]
MTEKDEDRRMEEELRRRAREEAARQPQAPEPPGPPIAPVRQAEPAADPPPPPPDVEALFRRLRAELDDMEGRVTAGIDAVAERVASVPGAAADLAEWVRRATARGEAVDRLAPLLEEAVERQNRLHRPARRRARAAGLALAIALAAALAVFVQWRFALIETPDPTAGWRGHLWERYGPELRDCVLHARRQGEAMLCQVFDPDPALP